MRPARRIALALAIAVAAPTTACGGGSGGDDHEADAPVTAEDAAPSTLLAPDDFADRIARPGAFVVNVHVPYEGEIEGTDVQIPFDQISGDDRLPDDKDAEIVLYCMTGRMSLTAAETLAGEGYSNIYDLEGGMKAWESAGKPLIRRP